MLYLKTRSYRFRTGIQAECISCKAKNQFAKKGASRYKYCILQQEDRAQKNIFTKDSITAFQAVSFSTQAPKKPSSMQKSFFFKSQNAFSIHAGLQRAAQAGC